MDVIVRNNGGRRGLVSFYRPISVLDEMERFSRQALDFWKPFELDETLIPYTDMYEEDGVLVMKTELPGIKKEDLDITLEGGNLIVRAEKRKDETEQATRYTRERYYGRYFRSVALPVPVKEDKVSATLENGVLEIRLPKAEGTKNRKIEIKEPAKKVESRQSR